MACHSCKRCGFSGCGKRKIPIPKKRIDGHTQRYWMRRERWIRKNFPNQDWDDDKVKNRLDCEPEDPRYQDIISKNISKEKSVVENPEESIEFKNLSDEYAKEIKQERGLQYIGRGVAREGEDYAKKKVEEDNKYEAKRKMDSTVAGLSSEELNRELEEIGEDPIEFSEVEARRKLRQHWEYEIENW